MTDALAPWLERLTSSVYGVPVWALLAGAIVAAALWDRHHAAHARDAVDRWAAQHGYRLVRCRRLWLSGLGLRSTGVHFGATDQSHQRHVHVFAVTVADRALGGHSRGRVRVRRDVRSTFDPEVEVSWDALNESDPALPEVPAGPSWEDAQLALLCRVADGECAFRPDDRHSDEAGERFDMLVEHVTAMQRRGWVTHAPPIAERRLPGRRYAALTDVELTEAGREVVERVRR